jgi:hypothetical protein
MLFLEILMRFANPFVVGESIMVVVADLAASNEQLIEGMVVKSKRMVSEKNVGDGRLS